MQNLPRPFFGSRAEFKLQIAIGSRNCEPSVRRGYRRHFRKGNLQAELAAEQQVVALEQRSTIRTLFAEPRPV